MNWEKCGKRKIREEGGEEGKIWKFGSADRGVEGNRTRKTGMEEKRKWPRRIKMK
jgi:hypothetical protein